MTARQFKLTGSTSYSSRLFGTVALQRGEHILLDAGKNADHIAALSQVVGDREETLFTEVGPGLVTPTLDLTTKITGVATATTPPPAVAVAAEPAAAPEVETKPTPQRVRRAAPTSA